jgi:hypothetical protein
MWLSGFCERYPTKLAWNRRAVAALGNPLLRRILGRRIQPGECYRFWDKYAFGFSEPCRDLVRSDLTVQVKRRVRTAIASMLTPRRSRMLIKITGWPRMGFLDAIFEDACFVHLVRDGRAVANSLLHVNFWRGWRGPQGWRAGLLSPEDEATWQAFDRSFVALAALEWRIQMRAIEAARSAIDPSRFLEIKYESFCERSLESCRRVLEFAQLPGSPALDQEVATASIKNMNQGWRQSLTQAQQDVLEELLRDDLVRYGYELSQAGDTSQRAVGC